MAYAYYVHDPVYALGMGKLTEFFLLVNCLHDGGSWRVVVHKNADPVGFGHLLPLTQNDRTVCEQQSLMPATSTVQLNTPGYDFSGRGGQNFFHCVHSYSCAFNAVRLKMKIFVNYICFVAKTGGLRFTGRPVW